MMRRSAVAVLLAGGLAIGLTACGDDDGDDESSALTVEEYQEQGNAICEAGNQRLDAAEQEVFGGGNTPPSQEQMTAFFETFTSDVGQQVDEISELEPPEELAEQHDAFIAEAQSTLGEVETGGAEAFFTSTDQPFQETFELANELGLTACGDQ